MYRSCPGVGWVLYGVLLLTHRSGLLRFVFLFFSVLVAGAGVALFSHWPRFRKFMQANAATWKVQF